MGISAMRVAEGGVWGAGGRGGSAGWPSGSPGSWTAQRGALGRYRWPTVGTRKEAHCGGAERARPQRQTVLRRLSANV